MLALVLVDGAQSGALHRNGTPSAFAPVLTRVLVCVDRGLVPSVYMRICGTSSSIVDQADRCRLHVDRAALEAHQGQASHPERGPSPPRSPPHYARPSQTLAPHPPRNGAGTMQCTSLNTLCGRPVGLMSCYCCVPAGHERRDLAAGVCGRVRHPPPVLRGLPQVRPDVACHLRQPPPQDRRAHHHPHVAATAAAVFRCSVHQVPISIPVFSAPPSA